MSSETIKLRGNAARRHELYPLGNIPNTILMELAKQVVHKLATGHNDIRGDDFEAIFSNSIEGLHRNSPLGIADIVKDKCAWSVKTIKAPQPHNIKKVRLISGRNSPDYSSGISNPRENPEETGDAVLSIWNARVNETLELYNDLRVLVLIRNCDTCEFTIFEEEAKRHTLADYRWAFNSNNNLEGYKILDNSHKFTWQPHGSQFTILRDVPTHAKKFSITEKIPKIEKKHILDLAGFHEDWVKINS